MASIDASRKITEKTAAECGLETPKIKVDVVTNDKGEFSVLLGGESPDKSGYYLKLSTSEDIYLVEPDKGKIEGVVESAIFKGVHYEMCVLTDNGQRWLVHDTNLFEVNSKVGILVKPFDIHVMKKSN